ncbi:hypothetical protein BDR26DRAFT_70667 [Obelidium mucronatum]|nr:hypothetical protein BDR26DRAFT_70667 [Obelidium mucronatum]
MPATTAANAPSRNQKWFPALSFKLCRVLRPSQHVAVASRPILESSPAPTHDHDHGSLRQQLSKKFNSSVNMITSLLAIVNHERAANKDLRNLLDQTIRQKEEELFSKVTAGNIAIEEMADLLKIKEAEAVDLELRNLILNTKIQDFILNEADSRTKATNDLTQMVDTLQKELANADKNHFDTVNSLNEAEKTAVKAAMVGTFQKCRKSVTI